jgi:DNA-binding transcriptional LysR family regulator
MLDSLRGFYVFAYVAETHSFSRAAERLNITKSAVSKHVAQLEAELSVQLIVRTTRKLALTEAGERVYEHCARVAGELEAAREAAHAAGSRIAGKLRITAPALLGSMYVVPVVTEFMAQHPELEVELLFDDAYIDLVQERIDIALRVGQRGDQSFVSRSLATTEFVVVGSPAYLARRGMPKTPHELSSYEWIVHGTSVSTPGKITFRKGRQSVTVSQRGRLSSNAGPTNLAAALAGHGIFVVPDFEVGEPLRDGSLVRLLPAWSLGERPVQLVFPPRKHVLGRVRAFADFLVQRFRVPPWRTSP